MFTHSCEYENSYFKFKINFPTDWKIRYKSNANSQLESKANYQIMDDDLPMEDEDYRTLVSAFRPVAGSSSMFGSKFSIVIHRHNYEYNLQSELKLKKDLTDVKFEHIQILNREAQSVKMIENAGNYDSITKIIAWREMPDIWFSIYMSGDSLENFQASENLLDHLIKI